jgi:hypothetical protein
MSAIPDSIRREDFEIVKKHTAWILQGNPDHFDVDQCPRLTDRVWISPSVQTGPPILLYKPCPRLTTRTRHPNSDRCVSVSHGSDK